MVVTGLITTMASIYSESNNNNNKDKTALASFYLRYNEYFKAWNFPVCLISVCL